MEIGCITNISEGKTAYIIILIIRVVQSSKMPEKANFHMVPPSKNRINFNNKST